MHQSNANPLERTLIFSWDGFPQGSLIVNGELSHKFYAENFSLSATTKDRTH